MIFRVGILGGGNISRTHTRAALEIDGVEVVAVCGENAENDLEPPKPVVMNPLPY